MAASRETSASLPISQSGERIAFIDQVFDGSLLAFPNMPRANLSGKPFTYQGRRYSVKQEEMVHGIMITGESFSSVDGVGERVRVLRGAAFTLFSYYRIRRGLIEIAEVNTQDAAERIEKFLGLSPTTS